MSCMGRARYPLSLSVPILSIMALPPWRHYRRRQMRRPRPQVTCRTGRRGSAASRSLIATAATNAPGQMAGTAAELSEHEQGSKNNPAPVDGNQFPIASAGDRQPVRRAPGSGEWSTVPSTAGVRSSLWGCDAQRPAAGDCLRQLRGDPIMARAGEYAPRNCQAIRRIFDVSRGPDWRSLCPAVSFRSRTRSLGGPK
jgi:hypothetical protein